MQWLDPSLPIIRKTGNRLNSVPSTVSIGSHCNSLGRRWGRPRPGGPCEPSFANALTNEELRRGLEIRLDDSTHRFIESRLRLEVNEAKSAVDQSSRRHFLGFRPGALPDGGIMVQLSKRSTERLYQKVRELVPRNWGQSLGDCIERTNRNLNGWMGYFRLWTEEIVQTLRHVDARIRHASAVSPCVSV